MRVTFKPFVNRYRLRKDNTYSVTIRIGVKSKYAFIDTGLSVSNKDLNTKGEIKNQFILSKCYQSISEYKEILLKIDSTNNLTSKEVKDYILTQQEFKDGLDFTKLFKRFINNECKKPSVPIYNTTYRHLVRHGGKGIMVDSITPHFLSGFQRHLESRMGSRGVQLYLSRVRAVYNWIMDEYEYKGYEFRYPFRNFKIPKSTPPKTVALTKEQLRAIIEFEPKGLRANRARNIFIISLLLLGVNAIDLYKAGKVGDNRFNYNRSKTKRSRDDDAFISVKIEDEVKPYLEKYLDEDRELIFKKLYANPSKLNEAIYIGLGQLRRQINNSYGYDIIDSLEYYDARRSLASIMRNELGISAEDIGGVLNHRSLFKTTDIYIEVDFRRNDECNRMFIDWLYG